MMRGMKHAYRLIFVLVIAYLFTLALQPGTKGLAVRAIGLEIETK